MILEQIICYLLRSHGVRALNMLCQRSHGVRALNIRASVIPDAVQLRAGIHS
jgi:hypothetical protein